MLTFPILPRESPTMSQRVLIGLLLGIPPTVAMGADEPRLTAIFPAEMIHNHASCVVELSNGDLLVTWYRGSGERRADDVQIMGARRVKGETAWRPRFVMADTPGYPDCNPAVFAAPDQSIWLFWPTILDHRWEGALLKFAMTNDPGPPEGPISWKREGVLHVTPQGLPEAMTRAADELVPPIKGMIPQKLIDDTLKLSRQEIYQRLGWMPRVHVAVLASGRWVLPLYCDTFSASIMAFSDDQGRTWSTSGPIIGFGAIQPSLVERNDGSLMAYMRDNGPFGRIRQAESKDHGKTWGPVSSSSLPNPGAGVEAIRLASGLWVMIYNDTTRGRHSLALAVSRDEGRTWTLARHLERVESGGGQFHYPSLMQSRDGTIHATYTRRLKDEGSTIHHAEWSEPWLIEGEASARKADRPNGTEARP
jgi:predicted neuraminidase